MKELWEIKDDFGKITIRPLPIKRETPKMFMLDLGEGKERRVDKEMVNTSPNLYGTGRGIFFTSREMALQTWGNSFYERADKAMRIYKAVKLLLNVGGEQTAYREGKDAGTG